MTSFLVGTYTTGTTSRGVYRVTLEGDRLENRGCVIEMKDPSYLAARGDRLYVVSEDLTPGQEGRLLRFERGPEGSFRQTAAASTRGISPCHVALSPEGDQVAVTNYTSGSVALFREEDLQLTALHQGSGSGPDLLRQSSSHAHQATFFRDGWLVCDLGGDCLWRQKGSLWETCRLPAGCGPRHLVTEGPLAYVGCELSNELLTLDLTDGTVLDRQTTLADPGAVSALAAVRRSGDSLFVSNRGEDSVSRFSLEDPAHPRRRGTWAVGGSNPRDILIRPDGILCACAEGLVWLKKEAGGSYQPAHRLALASAVAVLEEQ